MNKEIYQLLRKSYRELSLEWDFVGGGDNFQNESKTWVPVKN